MHRSQSSQEPSITYHMVMCTHAHVHTHLLVKPAKAASPEKLRWAVHVQGSSLGVVVLTIHHQGLCLCSLFPSRSLSEILGSANQSLSGIGYRDRSFPPWFPKCAILICVSRQEHRMPTVDNNLPRAASFSFSSKLLAAEEDIMASKAPPKR